MLRFGSLWPSTGVCVFQRNTRYELASLAVLRSLCYSKITQGTNMQPTNSARYADTRFGSSRGQKHNTSCKRWVSVWSRCCASCFRAMSKKTMISEGFRQKLQGPWRTACTLHGYFPKCFPSTGQWFASEALQILACSFQVCKKVEQ